MNQSELEANSCNRRQARENARHQVMIFFFFLIASESDTNTKRSKAKPKQTRNYVLTLK